MEGEERKELEGSRGKERGKKVKEGEWRTKTRKEGRKEVREVKEVKEV